MSEKNYGLTAEFDSPAAVLSAAGESLNSQRDQMNCIRTTARTLKVQKLASWSSFCGVLLEVRKP